MGGLEVRGIQITAAQANDRDDRQDRRDREVKRDTAAVFRAEEINDTDHDHEAHGGDSSVLRRDTKVTHRGPAAQRRGDEEIRDQKQGAGRGEEAALLPCRRINSAAVRKMGADDNVVESDDRGQRTDCEDERERREPRGHEGKTDDVSLARAPVAIEKGGGPLPVNVARPMHTRRFNKRFSHELCGSE